MRNGALVFAVCLISVLNPLRVGAEIPDTTTIPAELENWKPWVLYGHEEHFCPARFDGGDAPLCSWPSRLRLELSGSGGKFSQEWLVYVKSWAALPGGPAQFPVDVTVDGKSAPVVMRGESPSVFLQPGAHLITGSFTWDALPETLPVPLAGGLLSLSIDGKVVPHPILSQEGRLWLHRRADTPDEADRVDVRLFRLLDDSIPMRITTLLKVAISGKSREVRLSGVFLEGSAPMEIVSPLAARLGPSGDLLIQGRPGRFDITVVSRFSGPMEEIGPVTAPFGPEIWAFQARTPLRLVQVEGGSAIDPRQTEVPTEWTAFPAYVVESGTVMGFKTLRRGDPDPAPDQLHLKRTWWLDFDGNGYTVQDHMDGTLSRQWSLAMTPRAMLGRVSVDGTDQLITEQGPEKRPGVELRRGELHLVAESRIEGRSGVLSAVDWDHDFQSLSGVLNLPPGWRLLSARGVDVVFGTWFERWTLLDLFLVLIISLAVMKLWSPGQGVLALATLSLIYHEPEAPRLIWLHLLGAVALVRVLPDGWLKRWVNIYRWGAVVVLLAMTIPFMVQQLRWGIYPQLELVDGEFPVRFGTTLDVVAPPSPEREVAQEAVEPQSQVLSPSRGIYGSPREKKAEIAPRPRLAQDPKAVIQTGPGLPTWNWRRIPLRWNGPVSREQEIRLWLLSPAVNLLLAFLRVFLLAYLVFLLLDLKRLALAWSPPGAAAAGTLLLAVLGGGFMSQAVAGGYPSSQLLEELRQRLLKPSDCQPNCAEIPRMELLLEGEVFKIILTLDAAGETAVPLPATAVSWMPETVLWDDRPAEGLLRDSQGQLWLRALAGAHRVTLVGAAPKEPTVQLPLPLRPHRVVVSSRDWEVKGLQPDGRPDASLQLSRKVRGDAPRLEAVEQRLPPFLTVERVISLGLTWQVTTTVKRITPTGSPVTALIPLLNGESVTSSGVRVEGRAAVVGLEPQATEVQWASSLEETAEIHLLAPLNQDGPSWVETWILDAGPIWHCDLSGIPVIHHQDATGVWKPQWRPWPGETVTIRVSRPAAIPGRRVTVDRASLQVTPGERFRSERLTLSIRTSEGSRFPVLLPPDSTLEQVQINGQSQPIRQENRAVVIPLEPGSRSVVLDWRQAGAVTSMLRVSEVRIGADEQQAVNAEVTVNMPGSRWILWVGGPRLGPAVLFWSSLMVVILAAVGLGRISWTPLKTHHWLLLGLGLTQVDPIVALVVVGWLLAMGVRFRRIIPHGWFLFDVSQVLLVLWTLAALGCLYAAVHNGLLGIPHMQIAGNGSTDFHLRWTQDRITSLLPQPWVLSIPLMAYRLLMLLWALWLAASILSWLKWSYRAWTHGELWRKVPWPVRVRRGSPS